MKRAVSSQTTRSPLWPSLPSRPRANLLYVQLYKQNGLMFCSLPLSNDHVAPRKLETSTKNDTCSYSLAALPRLPNRAAHCSYHFFARLELVVGLTFLMSIHICAGLVPNLQRGLTLPLDCHSEHSRKRLVHSLNTFCHFPAVEGTV